MTKTEGILGEEESKGPDWHFHAEKVKRHKKEERQRTSMWRRWSGREHCFLRCAESGCSARWGRGWADLPVHLPLALGFLSQQPCGKAMPSSCPTPNSKSWILSFKLIPRLLRVPWTPRKSDQSILKELNPEYSLEGLMLKLKFWYFGHLMWRADSLERIWFWERLKAGGEVDDRGQDGWTASLTQWTCLSKLWEMVKGREAWRAAVHGVAKSWTRLSQWTTTHFAGWWVVYAMCRATLSPSKSFFFFFSGLNPGYRSESLESSTLGHQRTPKVEFFIKRWGWV